MIRVLGNLNLVLAGTKNHPRNICSPLVRTISICLYFARGRLYKRFNFEVEVSLGKFSKQVCITSESGRPTRGI